MTDEQRFFYEQAIRDMKTITEQRILRNIRKYSTINPNRYEYIINNDDLLNIINN